MTRLLFVFPLELGDGGYGNVQRMQELGRYFRASGFAADLICLGDPLADDQIPKNTRESFDGIRRVWSAAPSSLAAHLDSALVTFYGVHSAPSILRPASALTALARAEIESGRYAAVVVSYAWAAPMLADLASRVPRILDSQDILYRHAATCLAATGAPTAFTLSRSTEQFFWRQWEVVAAITDDDRREIAAHVGSDTTVITVPHAVPVVDAPVAGTDDLAFYVASDNDCNVRSVAWLLSDVWPLVRTRRPFARLQIAGPICDVLRQRALPGGVELLGFVDDVGPFQAAAGVVLAPYLYGSGLKIKVIEAAAAGKALVTTAAGLAGSSLADGRDAIVANEAPAMAEIIAALLADRGRRLVLGTNALTRAARDYNAESCYRPLIRALADRGVTPQGNDHPQDQPLIPAAAIERAVGMLATAPGRIFIYGNGTHTRALIPQLTQRGIRLTAVIDRVAVEISMVDGLEVWPFKEWSPDPSDVVLLSSRPFEAQMWQDLAVHRAAGIEMFGFYEPTLVTPGLARGRSGPLGTAGQHQDVQTRMVICDPNIRGVGGHYRAYASRLAGAARTDGIVPVIVGNRQSRDGPDAVGPTVEVLAAFESDYWQEMVHPPGVSSHEHLIREADLFRATFDIISGRLGIGSNDVVFLPCANLVETMAMSDWATRRVESLPVIQLLYRFGLDEQAENSGLTQEGVAVLLAHSLVTLQRAAGPDRVSVLSDSTVLSASYAAALGVEVLTVPIPVLAGGLRQRMGHPPFTFTYLGDTRPEKGFEQIPAVVQAFARECAAGSVRFVLQCNVSRSAAAATRAAVDSLRNRPGVLLLDGPLDDLTYDATLASADIVMLPYDPRRYGARTSGVLAEAIVAGAAVLVPEGTWLSSVLDASHGAGIVFGRPPHATIVDAARAAFAQRSALLSTAWSRRDRFAQLHNPASLLRHLLRRGGALPKKLDDVSHSMVVVTPI